VARVFLTGGSGFVGGALAEGLHRRGEEVIALARSDAAAAALAGRCSEVAPGDVLDEDSLAAGMKGCALAYHVAAVNTHCPADTEMLMRVNVGGAEAAVRAAARAGVPRIVLTSSAASLGEAPGTVGREETQHRGTYLSLYERSKLEGELAALAAARRLGVELVVVNPSSVQGPGRSTGTGKLLIAYLNGKLPVFVDTYISIVDIDDCTDGHRLAAERGRNGARYVLNGATVTSGEALEIVSQLSGIRQPIHMLPPPIVRTAAAVAELLARARGRPAKLCRARARTILHGHRYDGSLATRELGLGYTPIADTFRKTIDWAVAEGLVTRPLPGAARSVTAR
jgi:dihydroflavonol-4-reductase